MFKSDHIDLSAAELSSRLTSQFISFAHGAEEAPAWCRPLPPRPLAAAAAAPPPLPEMAESGFAAKVCSSIPRSVGRIAVCRAIVLRATDTGPGDPGGYAGPGPPPASALEPHRRAKAGEVFTAFNVLGVAGGDAGAGAGAGAGTGDGAEVADVRLRCSRLIAALNVFSLFSRPCRVADDVLGSASSASSWAICSSLVPPTAPAPPPLPFLLPAEAFCIRFARASASRFSRASLALSCLDIFAAGGLGGGPAEPTVSMSAYDMPPPPPPPPPPPLLLPLLLLPLLLARALPSPLLVEPADPRSCLSRAASKPSFFSAAIRSRVAFARSCLDTFGDPGGGAVGATTSPR